MKRHIPIVFLLFLQLLPSSRAEEISVMSYNLCNYFTASESEKPKSEDSKKALMGMIRAADPDILFVVELGGGKSLGDLLENMKAAGCRNYVFADEMAGDDDSRHIGLLSKFKPVLLEKKDNLFYRLKPKDKQDGYPEKVFVQRGFLHAVFGFENGYRLHLVGAHLKSRLPHPRYIQTDMRRYEARLLRYLVNQIREKEPGANVLVVGDFNDVYDSDPLRTLRAGDRPSAERLFDLRPLDSSGLPWTHWWNANDAYGRIDYALASESLLPEIDFERTKIIHLQDYWMHASDHRPVFVTIKTQDSSPLDREALDRLFTGSVHKDASELEKESSAATVPGKSPVPADRIVVCFMDLGISPPSDPGEIRSAIVKDLIGSNAGIIVLSGVRDAASAEAIGKMLPEYGFLGKVEGADRESVLAVFSKTKPEKFEALTDMKYKIEDKEMPVSKGFAHCVFRIGDYSFHLVAADLKDRTLHPDFNQTDMRRYEARQLRYLVNDIAKAEPSANILVVGNLNDTCGMSPLKELYNRRSGIEKRLFDIRPLDRMKTTWTSWDRGSDEFERIDYALANFAMVSEIDRAGTAIIPSESWRKFPLHRPLVVAVSCRDAGKPSKEELDRIYPYSIYSGEAAHFEEDKEIGDRPERKGAAFSDDE